MNWKKYFIAFFFYIVFYNSNLFADLPALSLKTDKDVVVKVETKEYTSTEEKKDNNTGDDKTSLKLTIPQELVKTNTQAIQHVKIDDDTTAKITISAKQKDVEKKTEEKKIVEKKIDTETREIKVPHKIDINNLQQEKVIVIKDGDKNINIILQPEIVGCKDCQKNKSNQSNQTIKKTNKTITYTYNVNADKETVKNTNNVKNKTTTKTQNSKKQTKNKKNIQKQQTKTTKKTKNNNTDNKKPSKQEQEKVPNGDGIYEDIVPIDQWDKEEHKTIRKMYENNEISCVGQQCNNLITTKNKEKNNSNNGLKNKTTTENLSKTSYKNVDGENVKIIEKETTIVEQPVYVVNRIINVDEDMNLTEEQINQIASDTGGSVAIVNGNGNNKSKKYSQRTANVDSKFRQQFDIINSNKMSYGEVAFVDDYND